MGDLEEVHSAPLFPDNSHCAFPSLDAPELHHIAKHRPLGFTVSRVKKTQEDFPSCPAAEALLFSFPAVSLGAKPH